MLSSSRPPIRTSRLSTRPRYVFRRISFLFFSRSNRAILTFVPFRFPSPLQSDLEAYIHQVESTITGPELSLKIKRGAKAAVEAELAKALEKLEIEEST